jgi:hypothetical protein
VIEPGTDSHRLPIHQPCRFYLRLISLSPGSGSSAANRRRLSPTLPLTIRLTLR